MEWWALSIILFGGMLFLLFLGVNIPFALGLTAVVGIFMVWDRPMIGMMTIATEAYIEARIIRLLRCRCLY